MSYRTALAICLGYLVLVTACSRRPSAGVERLAILQFESLSPDPSTAWIGRAFPEVIAGELANSSGFYAIPTVRLHGYAQTVGVRPAGAPGISAEEPLALAAAATRIGYGEYFLSGGRLHARLTIYDARTHRVAEGPIETSVEARDVLGAATAMAHAIWPKAQPYSTRNPAALQPYIQAIQTTDLEAVRHSLEQSIAIDPDFGAVYALLAELRLRQQDRAGANAALEAAAARGNGIRAFDRIRLDTISATLHGDAAGQARALAAFTVAAPRDPLGWRALGDAASRRRDFARATQSYEQAAAIDPQDVGLWNTLGYTAAYAGSLDNAMNALRRYEALRPLDPNPLDSMGDVNLMAGRNAEAERLYLAAYKKNPSFLGGSDLYKAGVARLMTGDLAGAESIAKQGSGEMASSPEWLWISGRRKEAYEALATKAPRLTADALAMANINLAIWAALLNDRASAARIAQQAAGVATQATAANFMLAKFLTLPPASATEWAVRAEQVFPNAPPNSLKDLALADALLLNGHFAAAIPLLKQLEAVTPASGDRSLAIELAWALIETGKFNEAAPLLRWNPVPSVNGMTPLVGLYFPRLYRLRAAVAEHQGKADEARENRRIYAALGGQ